MKSYEELLKQGDQASSQGRFDEALELYGQAKALAPARQEARKQIINIQHKKEDFGKAFHELLDWAAVVEQEGKPDEALKILLDAINTETQEKRGLFDKKSGPAGREKEQFQKVAPNFYEKIGELYYNKKEYNSAIDFLEKTIEAFPNHAKAHALLGLSYLAKGLLDRAKGPFQEVVRFGGTESALAYEKLAEIYSQQGNVPQMVIWLKDAADAYIKLEQRPQAIQVLEKILKAEAENKEVLHRLGELYAKEGKREESCRLYKRLADLYARAGVFDKVLVIYEKLVEWEPDNQGRVEEIIKIYRDLLSGDPANLSARIKLIEHLLRKGSVEEVVVEYLYLIDGYVKIGLMDEAIHCCEKVLAFDPLNLKITEKLADLYSNSGKPDEAGKILVSIVEQMPEVTKDEKSAKIIQKAITFAGEDAELHLTMAKELMKRQSYGEALEELKKILAEDPNHAEALALTGDLLAAGQRYPEAEETFAKLLKQSPNDLTIQGKVVKLYETQLLREMEEFAYRAG